MEKNKQKKPDLQKWNHPGGKLRELGAENLSDSELLSIIISTGIKGKSAEKIAEEIIRKFGSFKGMANQPFEKFYKIHGLSEVKITRIARTDLRMKLTFATNHSAFVDVHSGNSFDNFTCRSSSISELT